MQVKKNLVALGLLLVCSVGSYAQIENEINSFVDSTQIYYNYSILYVF